MQGSKKIFKAKGFTLVVRNSQKKVALASQPSKATPTDVFGSDQFAKLLSAKIADYNDAVATQLQASQTFSEDHKQMMINLASHRVTDILSPALIAKYNILKKAKVSIFNGQVVDSRALGYAHNIPKINDYLLFQVVPDEGQVN